MLPYFIPALGMPFIELFLILLNLYVSGCGVDVLCRLYNSSQALPKGTEGLDEGQRYVSPALHLVTA